MAYSPTNKDLAKKIDELPDALIKRLDDRYLKKDDAENTFITRREAGLVIGLLTGAATVIGLLISAAQFITNFFSRGN